MAEEFRLQGRVVTLRPSRLGDVADYEAWNRSDLKAWQFDGPWYPFDLSGLIAGRRKWIEAGCLPPYRFLEVETAADGRHIGWVVAYFKPDDPHATEVGIDLPEDCYWGGGRGTEALALWVDYLFNVRGQTRLGLTTWEGNPAMIRVAHKLGFVEEGRMRRSCEVAGRFYDRVRMGLLCEEWQAVRRQVLPLHT